MSVIVKGVEIPKSCSKCGWFDMGGGDGYRCTLLRKSFDMWNKISVARDKNCPLIEIPTSHGDLVDLNDTVHPNDSMRRMTIDEQLRRTCEGWSADRKQYVVIEAEGSEE